MNTDVFREVKNGWTVHPSAKIKLPGMFLNFVAAQRAYDKYMSMANEAKAARKRKG